MVTDYKTKMTQTEYRALFSDELNKRENELEQFVRKAFANHIVAREELVIDLSSITTDELARLISTSPVIIIQTLFRLTGASPRSIARDLRVRIGPETRTVSPELALDLASYFAKLLPFQLPIRAFLFHDRIQRENELTRAYKGRWEEYVRSLLSKKGLQFAKRRFRIGKKTIEIDCAYPPKGDPRISIDVKRIEALEDYQKRTDEINAKARELKSVYKVVFIGCIFFPFLEKRQMVLNRLDRTVIDQVYFQDETASMVTRISEMARDLPMH